MSDLFLAHQATDQMSFLYQLVSFVIFIK